MAIYRYLDESGITMPAAIGEALEMLAAEANSLLTWRSSKLRRHGRDDMAD